MAKKLSDEEVSRRFADAGLEPLEPYINSHVPRLCRCLRCGSEIRARLTWFAQGFGACNVCAYRQRAVSLKKYSPEKAEGLLRKMGYEPLEPYPGRKNDPWRARCTTCGHEGTPRVKTLEKGHGCQICAAAELGSTGRDERAPQAVADMRAASVDPLEPFPGVNKPWHSRCLTCGTEVWPRLSGIRQGQGACKPCGMRRVADSNRLSHEVAAEIMRQQGLEVLEPYVNSNTPWRCRCLTCGALGSPTLGSVSGGRQGGCFECGKKKVAASKILDADVAEATMRAAQLEPLEPYPGTSVPWRCRCLKCDREVTPRRSALTKGQGGCKYCATVGLDRTAPGILYLMRHDEFHCLKIGVSSTASRVDRIDRHRQFGWRILYRWDTENAGLAETAETLILSMWRHDIGAPVALTPADMPQGGYSETAALLHVSEDDALFHVKRALTALDITAEPSTAELT